MNVQFANARRFVLALLVLTATARLEAGPCEYEWRALPQALEPAAYPPYFHVSALVEFNDGTVPAVFASGTFGGAGGMTSRGIAKCNGETWTSLNGGVDQ